MTKPKTLTKAERTERVLRSSQIDPRKVWAMPVAKAPVYIKPVPALAASPTNDLFARGAYRTGDGDVVRALRPGANDHLQFKSKGISDE